MQKAWGTAAVCVLALAASGCAGLSREPQSGPEAAAAPQPGAAQPSGTVAGKEQSAARRESRPAPGPAAEPASAAKSEVPAAKPAEPVSKPETPVARVEPPGPPKPATPAEAPVNDVKKDAPNVAAPKPAAPAPKPIVVKPGAPAAPKPSTLDLAALEKRLKETSAIGLMTKLALKNQVDELLDRFRAHYDGRVKTNLAQLRQPYDMLILKVLTLLQDEDPSLAKSVADSREAIWGILSDPGKFRNL